MYNTQSMLNQMVDILDSKKAENIVVLDISKMSIIADYFIIASGRSEVQVKALYDELEEKIKEKGTDLLRVDGTQSGRWIVLDYGYIIVHIFHHEEREFYNLERLWADAHRVGAGDSSPQ